MSPGCQTARSGQAPVPGCFQYADTFGAIHYRSNIPWFLRRTHDSDELNAVNTDGTLT